MIMGGLGKEEKVVKVEEIITLIIMIEEMTFHLTLTTIPPIHQG